LITLVIFLIVLLFSLSLARDQLSSLALTKPQADFWDVGFKGLGGLVAVIGATLALSKHFDEREKENRAALIEAQKPFSTKRQEIYFQLISCTATLSNRDPDPNDPVWREASAQFWWLFWGPVPMVADDQVGSAVNNFSDALYANATDGVLLRNLSMDLAKACRRSLGFIDIETPARSSAL
jgi:hypothetical protein